MENWYTLEQTNRDHINTFYNERAMDRLAELVDDSTTRPNHVNRFLRAVRAYLPGRNTHRSTGILSTPLEAIDHC